MKSCWGEALGVSGQLAFACGCRTAPAGLQRAVAASNRLGTVRSRPSAGRARPYDHKTEALVPPVMNRAPGPRMSRNALSIRTGFARPNAFHQLKPVCTDVEIRCPTHPTRGPGRRLARVSERRGGSMHAGMEPGRNGSARVSSRAGLPSSGVRNVQASCWQVRLSASWSGDACPIDYKFIHAWRAGAE